MVLSKTLDRIRRIVRKRGVFGAMRRVFGVVYRRRMQALRATPHPFDIEHGVDTGGLHFAKSIRSGHPNDAQSTAYFGSQPSVVRAGLARWLQEVQSCGLQAEAFTFVDIGCGKGRALMLASEWPFGRAVGLELSPELADLAKINLARWQSRPHRCRELSVLQTDVLEYPLPAEPTLLFMYHPFEGELFGRWVERLRAAVAQRTSPLYLLYMNPVYGEMLGTLPGAARLWDGFIEFTPGEIAAHLFGGTAERIALYLLASGYE